MKVSALILALGMVASAALGSAAYYQGRTLSNTLEVTGSARQQITSDRVKWSASWSRDAAADTVKTGYQSMASDEQKVSAFFKAHGIDAKSVDITPISIDQDYTYNQNDPNAPKRYVLRQYVQLRSEDVQGVTDLTKKTKELIDQGVLFASQNLEYTYSKLPDLRVSLLGESVKDAKARAAAIAGSEKVGAMRSASVGVVQVLPVGSTEVSDYGAYDTSKIEKEVMVTVRASFSLK